MRQTSKAFFNDEQRRRIDESVRRAEEGTSAEIVPVLASSADQYEGGLFLAGITGAFLASLTVFAVAALPLGDMDFMPWSAPLWLLLPCQAVALLGGYHLARGCARLHRSFVPRALMQHRVDQAAKQAFSAFHLSQTRDATGIMIYVSLFERMAVVLADRAINEKHDKQTWDGVRDLLLAGLGSGDGASGYEQAVNECGRILAQDFPVKPDDTNELPNNLRIL